MIKIPEKLLANLGPEMAMDVHWIDVKLKDKSIRKSLVVRGGQYITGNESDLNGEGKLDLQSSDILNIRRQALFSWWPFWPKIKM